MFHFLKLNLLFPILALGLWSCATRPTGDTRQTKPVDPNWTPEIQQRVAQFQNSLPWVEETPELTHLRRELFHLRHRLIKAGEDIELQAPLYRNRIENLEMDVRAPETHLVGEPLVLDISFHNRGEIPISILNLPWAYTVELTHESGRYIQYWSTPPRARFFPREEDYHTILPGETFSRKLGEFPQRLAENLPPGRYHVGVYHELDSNARTVWSSIREVRFLVGQEVNGLRATLKLDDTNGNEAEESPWFSATLTNTSDRPIRIIPSNGVLVFPDAVTGRELEMWPRMEGQAEPPPRYRPYLTSIEIITLRPGEEYTRRVTPRETYQPWERRLTHWWEALAEGRQYEVQWHYTIPPAWFVEDAQFQTVNSWIGRLASNSVTYTRQPRPPSQPAE